VELPDPCGVGVVDHRHRTTESVAQQLLGVGADPRRVDVGRRAHHAVGHDGRQCHTDGGVAGVIGEVLGDLHDEVGNRVR